MRSTSLIDKTSTLCEAKSALISERKDSVLLTIFSSASVSSSVSVGVIITLITARSSLDLVETVAAIPTNSALTDDNGILLASAMACSKMAFIPAKVVSFTPFNVRLTEIGATAGEAKN